MDNECSRHQLNKLPINVLYYITSQLDYQSVVTLSQVSKRFHQVSIGSYVWKTLLGRDFPDYDINMFKEGESFREMYIISYAISWREKMDFECQCFHHGHTPCINSINLSAEEIYTLKRVNPCFPYKKYPMRYVPNCIFHLPYIEKIYDNGYHSQIKNFTYQMGNLKRLKHIQIWKGEISDLKDQLRNSRSLKTFTMEETDMNTLPSYLFSLNSIRTIKLIKTGMKKFPEILNHMDERKSENERTTEGSSESEVETTSPLTELIIRESFISKLPETIHNLKNVTRLMISESFIKRLPITFSTLQNITNLCLSENRINLYPKEIESLPNLENLCLCYNNISFIPEGIKHNLKLERFCIGQNLIKSISNGIGKLKRLEILNLESNLLQHINKGILQLDSLKHLSLYDNCIIDFPPGLFKMDLKRLIFDGNYVVTYDKDRCRRCEYFIQPKYIQKSDIYILILMEGPKLDLPIFKNKQDIGLFCQKYEYNQVFTEKDYLENTCMGLAGTRILCRHCCDRYSAY